MDCVILIVACVRPYNYQIYCTCTSWVVLQSYLCVLISVGFKCVCYSTYFIVSGITVNVKFSRVINFMEEAHVQMRYSPENFFAQCTLHENIYTSILYYITNIRGELQLAIYGRALWQLHSRHCVVC